MKIKWDIQHVYYYLVSFVALILLIIGAVNITRTAIIYVTPYPVSSERPYFDKQAEDLWKEHFGPAFIEQENQRFAEINKSNNSRGLVRDLIAGLAFIMIALPVYLYHWRKIPHLEET